MFCFNELMPVYVKLDTWDQPVEELGGLAMYDATCRSELQKMETAMYYKRKHVSTLQVCCGTRMDSKRKRIYSTYRSKSSLTP